MINNKYIFLCLSILFFSLSTQCMEFKTIAEIQRNWEKTEINYHADPTFSCCINYSQHYAFNDPYFKYHKYDVKDHQLYCPYDFNGYSLMAVAAMGVEHSSKKIVSFVDKKKFINELALIPTKKDRYIVLLEKWNRCNYIRNKINVLCMALHRQQIPLDIINTISQMTFDAEESLF